MRNVDPENYPTTVEYTSMVRPSRQIKTSHSQHKPQISRQEKMIKPKPSLITNQNKANKSYYQTKFHHMMKETDDYRAR